VRVLTRCSGLDPAQPAAPPELCPGLDLPAWQLLARLAPDWMLPGVGQLDDDIVLALQSNPAFIDALLVGLNTKLVEELRWRNLRITTGCTPMRAFWQRSDPATGARVDDIRGIAGWASSSTLGAADHRPAGGSGTDLVLMFRSALFRRYPQTLLYLVSAIHGGAADFTRDPDAAATRRLPAFQGRIGPDTTFFGFPGLPAADVAEQWVVLEEPPTGFRFRAGVAAALAASDGAVFADEAFADPVRVLIAGNSLLPSGGTP
jgi:hypothetical protein